MSDFRKITTLLLAAGALLVLGVQFVRLVSAASDREVANACRGLRPDRNNPSYPEGIPSQGGAFPTALGFELADHTGKKVKLSDYVGKVVMVNFFASWCNVCKGEKPGLEKMQARYGSEDLVVLALASDTDWEEVKKKAFPNGTRLSVLLDPPAGEENLGQTAKRYGITAVPETFVVDRAGKLRYYFINRRDWNSDVANTCIDALVRSGE